MSKKVPRKEAELVALVEVMIGGLKVDPKIFTDPPLTFEQLTNAINKINLSVDKVAQKKSDYHKAIKEKNANLNALYNNAREIAEYCYRISKNNQVILAKVGLTPRAVKQSVESPGQCRSFTVVKQEIDSATFKWKEPIAGGKIRAYIIQRKESKAPADTWINLWMEIGKEVEIKKQPSGVFLDYRVRSLNKSGIGESSNTVTLKF